jgi:mannose-6-phosphate isomerase-like protein (cupin superfamily)
MRANAFDFSSILESSKQRYSEFLRVPSMSVGIYVLEGQATDYQKPHSEDEVYYVASGRAKMMTESEGKTKTFDVGPGSIIFVPALVHHSFYDITEKLSVLVFFAPAEGSKSAVARNIRKPV